ncbi:AraC family transcriptional regulator [uncultured Chitinophaga sp.]|uniref:AraC family transcriptional regulator n=1 Tax=uncultured Chitinophaga sp. TaxID=339340 RepID=UPI0025FA2264|nr:AraC family transcriptional regulator [uncultured Chitinophaga sp.]
MIILAGLHPSAEQGAEILLPEYLRSAVAAWAAISYRRFTFGNMLSQTYSYKNFQLYHYQFNIHTPVTVYPSLEKGTIALQFMLKGDSQVFLKGYGSIKLPARRWALSYIPAGPGELRLEAGEYALFHISIADSYLNEMAESMADVGSLTQLLEQGAEQAAILPLAYMDTKVNETINYIMKAEDSPQELPVEFKAHITTLLNLYRKSIREATEFELLPEVPHKEIVVDFARQIKADPSRPYSITKLAQRHRVYYKTLARSFKTLTGVSVKLYVHEQRMLLAFNMAATSQLPYSEIAAELGYLEPNNLNRAFKQRFGITLSEARNSGS